MSTYKKTKVDLLTQALQYRELDGFAVMPVSADKRPLLKEWKQYQTNKPTDGEIRAWWQKFPDANIGIITGKVSGITVIDIDSYKEGTTTISLFPPTRTVRTGNGGLHLIYDYQEGITISAGAFPQFPNLDLRGDGGFIVAAGSTTDYLHNGVKKGGHYELINSHPIAPFPVHLFPKIKQSRPLSSKIAVKEGSRNDSIASFIGTLLKSHKKNKWESDVWPAVIHTNKTYVPPLAPKELRATFDSIVAKESEQRMKKQSVLSPIQLSNGEKIALSVRTNQNSVPFKDMANVLIVLSTHPEYKDAFRYNEFRQEIEYNGKSFEEGHLVHIQYEMQVMALPGISKDAVYGAIQHYANMHSYDEVKDWLAALKWDGTERLSSWLSEATGVVNDSYHSTVGIQWFMGMIRRILLPGSIFDYMLVLVGAQGIGKTSFFRILGGPWYKSYTGAIDNKDFYLALRGALIVDLDEGATLYKSEAIKIKSIITQTHDEYRAPYDRVMKKYPRRFVFSMSTNDTEPFRDVTGNRRYWAIDGSETIRFKWLEDNRDQLFAEACHYFQNKTALPDVPSEKAAESQEAHLPQDSWTDIISKEVRKSKAYCEGDIHYKTTISDIYAEVFGPDKLERLNLPQQIRIGGILKKELGLEHRRIMIDGTRQRFWVITSKKIEELKKHNAEKTPDAYEEF